VGASGCALGQCLSMDWILSEALAFGSFKGRVANDEADAPTYGRDPEVLW